MQDTAKGLSSPFKSLLTVAYPVRNEEDNLGQALTALRASSLQHCPVVIIDSQSTDSTAQIGASFGCHVIQFQWDGKFPKKRNWFLRTYPLQTEWILFLDADEHVTANFAEEVGKTIPQTLHNGFWLNYLDHIGRKPLHHGVKFQKLALFRVGSGEYEMIDENSWSNLDMEVHEHPIIYGSVGLIKSKIKHFSYHNLDHYIRKHNEYSTWEAKRYFQLQRTPNSQQSLTKRQRLKYRLVGTIWWAPAYFIYQYFITFGFLDRSTGLIFSIHKFYYHFLVYQKIRELTHSKS